MYMCTIMMFQEKLKLVMKNNLGNYNKGKFIIMKANDKKTPEIFSGVFIWILNRGYIYT